MLNTISFWSPNNTIDSLVLSDDGSFHLYAQEDITWNKSSQAEVIVADIGFLLPPGYYGKVELLPKWKRVLRTSTRIIDNEDNLEPVWLSAFLKKSEVVSVKKGEAILKIEFSRKICPTLRMIPQEEISFDVPEGETRRDKWI